MAEINLSTIRFLIRAVRRHFVAIVGLSFVCAVVSAVYVLVIDETYESQTSLLVARPRLKEEMVVDTGSYDVLTFRDLALSGSVVQNTLERVRWMSRVLQALCPTPAELRVARLNQFADLAGLSATEIRRRVERKVAGSARDFEFLAELEPQHWMGLADLDPQELAKLRAFDLVRRFRAQTSIVEETNVSKVFSSKIDLYAQASTGAAAKLWADVWVKTFMETAEHDLAGPTREVAETVIQLASRTEAMLQESQRRHLALQNELLIDVQQKDLETRQRILYGPPVVGQDAPLMQVFKFAESSSVILEKEIEQLEKRINRQRIGSVWIGDVTAGFSFEAILASATGEVRRIVEARERLDRANEMLSQFRERSRIAVKERRLAHLTLLLATAAQDLYRARQQLHAAHAATVELGTRSSAPGMDGPTFRLRRSISPELALVLGLVAARGERPPGGEEAWRLYEEELDPAYRSLRDGLGRYLVELEWAKGQANSVVDTASDMEMEFTALDAELTRLRQEQAQLEYSAKSAEKALDQFRQRFNEDLAQLQVKTREYQKALSDYHSLVDVVSRMEQDVRQGQAKINEAKNALAASERQVHSLEETFNSLQATVNSARSALELGRADIRPGPAASLPDRRIAPKRTFTVIATAVVAAFFLTLFALARQLWEENQAELISVSE